MAFVLGVLVLGFLGITLFLGWYTVEQRSVRVVERFGKFVRIGQPGLNFKIPWIEQVGYAFDMRVLELGIEADTKTEDNVFLGLAVSVQYEVIESEVYKAYYKLGEPKKQIVSYVMDAVRSHVPGMKLDEVFVQKDEIARQIEESVKASMEEFGYRIVKVLITDISPAGNVVEAMNEINASLRLREAATAKADAEKIVVVKNAEAEAESKALQGKGIADQRRAIIEGLKDSVEAMRAATGASSEDVMSLVLLTQYFDTLKDIGQKSNTIMLPSSPGGMGDMMSEIRKSVMIGNVAADTIA